MINEVRKVAVFTIRNFRMLMSYKLAFSVSFLSIVFNFLYFVLFGSIFATSQVTGISIYNTDYVSYILVGSIGWGFLWSIMSTTGSSIRTEMLMGTLESIMLTRTKMYTMLVAYTFFGCLFGFISLVILVSIGAVFFGFDIFMNANIYTLIIFILSAVLMMGFGMIFGGLTIWIKDIGETIPLLQSITTFFCGVYFPITALPHLQGLAKFIPFYYSIESLRLSLVPDVSETLLIDYILKLFILSILFLIIGLLTVKIGLNKAKKEGSLSFY